MAFASPSYKKTISPEGYCTLAPSDYIPYFQKKNVGLVIRLNKKNYDETEFTKAGMDHLEQFYLDGSCPPMKILHKVSLGGAFLYYDIQIVPRNRHRRWCWLKFIQLLTGLGEGNIPQPISFISISN